MDYVRREFRGFGELAFSNVDSLVLSELSYMRLPGLVPAFGEAKSVATVPIRDLLRAESYDEMFVSNSSEMNDYRLSLLRAVCESPRFRRLRVGEYAERLDEGEQQQFAAMTFDLGADFGLYVAFRGTDGTLVGWKEDFNMSFIMPVPSQEAAVEYINSTCQYIRGRLYIGGHSKGGNLAIYSAVKCSERVRKKIDCVYNNDGPGFDVNMIKSAKYQAMLPLIKSIVPENSIVGMLLEHDEDYIIVKSSQSGLMQHDAMSWQVLGAFLVKAKKLSAQSRRLNKALSSWINSVDNERREEFVETLFGLLYASGAKNLSDVSADRLRSTREVIRQYAGLDKDSRTLIKNMLLSLTDKISKARFEK